MQGGGERQSRDTHTVPWDIRERVGLFPALGRTITMVLFQPDEFFRSVRVSDNVTSPRNFFILVQFINFSVMGVIHFLSNPATPPLLYLIMLVFFVPIIMLTLLLVSAVMHVFVRLAGGKKKFKATFHVMAYSSVTGLWQGVPWAGGLISLIWGIYVGIIGLRRVQGLSVPRAVIACVMPSVMALSLMFAYVWAPKHYRVRDIDKNDRHMQMTLKGISTELENYAQQHDGRYPTSLDQVKSSPPLLEERYCGVNRGGFLVSCRFADDGYVLTATPIIIEKTGTTTLTVQTGGVSNFGD
ncbi:MAG TPA: Yip1 family protein [Candidatus Omnitrophota bacterium]|nr:Yip1 family protein [Candidatus Omnitrophota bacterium]